MKLHAKISSSAYLVSPPEQLYLFRELIYIIVGQVSAFALECCGKYTYDFRLNSHTLVHVVSKALGVITKNTKLLLSTVT